MVDVQTLYDEHPLNEGEILSKLVQAGKGGDGLLPEDLFPFDQDHYGGIGATEALAARLALTPQSTVLDLCSGLGGTSRYLAHTYRCRVVGVDLNASRTAAAVRLTERVGLQDRVSFVQCDACGLEFEPESFDAAIGQEAFLHLPDKGRLMESCHGVLRPGARLAFSDWIAFEGLSDAARARLREAIAALDIADETQYRGYLAAAGFRDVEFEDVSPAWRVILHERLEMFESLREETVRRFGEERHRKYMEAYHFFVKTIDAGTLGGGRFFAVR